MVPFVRHTVDKRAGIPTRFEQCDLRFVGIIFCEDIGTA